MKGKMPDTYERWERSGHLESKLKAIAEMTSKRATQKEIAQYLGITQKTVIKLRKKHPRLEASFQYGDEELRKSLEDAMLKKALGFEYEETVSVIEETKRGTKKKVTKYKKHALPDFSSIKYLLITRFGIDYNDKKAEIKLMEKRIENNEEVWSGENSFKKNKRTK